MEQIIKMNTQLNFEGLTILRSEQNLCFGHLPAEFAVIFESAKQKYRGIFDDLNNQQEIRDAHLAA